MPSQESCRKGFVCLPKTFNIERSPDEIADEFFIVANPFHLKSVRGSENSIESRYRCSLRIQCRQKNPPTLVITPRVENRSGSRYNKRSPARIVLLNEEVQFIRSDVVEIVSSRHKAR